MVSSYKVGISPWTQRFMVKGPFCCEFSDILEFIGMNTHTKSTTKIALNYRYISEYLRRGKKLRQELDWSRKAKKSKRDVTTNQSTTWLRKIKFFLRVLPSTPLPENYLCLNFLICSEVDQSILVNKGCGISLPGWCLFIYKMWGNFGCCILWSRGPGFESREK